MLGLIEHCGEATPYELKALVNRTVGNFWSLQHAQLYSEPQRLTKAGYLKETREEAGRRRRHYSITKKGRDALAEWRDSPTDRVFELRDLGLLKVFFGADPAEVADGQIDMFRRKLAEYEEQRALDAGDEPRGPWATLDAGIRHSHTAIEFWEDQRGKRRRRG